MPSTTTPPNNTIAYWWRNGSGIRQSTSYTPSIRHRAVTSTGAALFPAVDCVGPGGIVIGLDPSRDMLHIAWRKGAALLLEGPIPGSCFLENTFDVISTNFVLSHVDDYQAELQEIYSILKPGGTFGATTWGAGQQHYNTIWNDTARQFISDTVLREIGREYVPRETWFEDVDNSRQAFSEAGFDALQIETKAYTVPMSLPDYLTCRYTLLSGKFIHKLLTEVTQGLRLTKNSFVEAA